MPPGTRNFQQERKNEIFFTFQSLRSSLFSFRHKHKESAKQDGIAYLCIHQHFKKIAYSSLNIVWENPQEYRPSPPVPQYRIGETGGFYTVQENFPKIERQFKKGKSEISTLGLCQIIARTVLPEALMLHAKFRIIERIVSGKCNGEARRWWVVGGCWELKGRGEGDEMRGKVSTQVGGNIITRSKADRNFNN